MVCCFCCCCCLLLLLLLSSTKLACQSTWMHFHFLDALGPFKWCNACMKSVVCNKDPKFRTLFLSETSRQANMERENYCKLDLRLESSLANDVHRTFKGRAPNLQRCSITSKGMAAVGRLRPQRSWNGNENKWINEQTGCSCFAGCVLFPEPLA